MCAYVYIEMCVYICVCRCNIYGGVFDFEHAAIYIEKHGCVLAWMCAYVYIEIFVCVCVSTLVQYIRWCL